MTNVTSADQGAGGAAAVRVGLLPGDVNGNLVVTVADQVNLLPVNARLNGTASDDGLPSPPGAMTLSWTKVSGPGALQRAGEC